MNFIGSAAHREPRLMSQGTLVVPLLMLMAITSTLFATSLWGVETKADTSDSDPSMVSFYLKKVKPLLQERCFACHGALKQEGGLRLDTAASILRGGDSGSGVVPGQAKESLLVQRVAHPDLTQRMPPENEGAPFQEMQLSLLNAWIDAGAKGPDQEEPEKDPREHWSFQTVLKPQLPRAKHPSGTASVEATPAPPNAIDLFIEEKLSDQGLLAVGPAKSNELLRRLYIDLLGVPPTLAELEAFEKDPSEQNYARIVESLLADPRYGERWARHWMDIWRYSDWWGLGEEVRNSQKHMWHYRDWLIESINEDLPYDEMIRQMLAADELYPEDLRKLRATGYLARTYFKFNRNTWLDDTVEHVGKGILGLTVNCSRCHDHKYDPITQHDYYRLRAFFEPYQVRQEFVDGVIDPQVNSIPRVFDCNLDRPTYRFERGDEKRPDQSQVLPPDVPEILKYQPIEITPVSLPAIAHQPGLRPEVIAAHQQAIANKRQSAIQKINDLQSQLDAAKREASDDSSGLKSAEAQTQAELQLDEPFDAIDASKWSVRGGQWSASDGYVSQNQDGPTRSELRLKLPYAKSFEASLTLEILGGSQYRSVGIGFDSTSTHESIVYLSAHDANPKIQGSIRAGNEHSYPQDAMVARPVPLNKKQTLTIRVRGDLVNALVDGQNVLAWQLPKGRQDGELVLFCFDVLARFHHFALKPLASDTPMQFTASQMQMSPEKLRADLNVAQAELAAIEQESTSLIARYNALRARWIEAKNVEETAMIAGKEVAKLRYLESLTKLKKTEGDRTIAPADKHAELDKAIEEQRKSSEDLLSKIDIPVSDFEPISGAEKTAENNIENDATRKLPFPQQSTGRRSALAKWITDPRHPLTARVAVNHLWNRHLGRPLVPTLFDFGRKGQEPAHPQLLDWLAADFVEKGWSMKELHRQIVTSKLYKRSSSSLGAATALAKDPENRYYWRRDPIRVEAQVVRDTILALSGDIDWTRGGPSLHPSQQEFSNRRSIYFVHSHNDHHRFLVAFDDASVQECYRRDQSIVPQQSLALFNSRFALESAEKIAQRIEQMRSVDGGANEDADFIVNAFRMVLQINPNQRELDACVRAIEQWKEQSDDPNKATLRARTSLVLTLLNHNDFVTLR